MIPFDEYSKPGAAFAPSGGLPFGSILQGDPGYASAANQATRSAQDAQSARQAAIRSALIAAGIPLPAGFKDTYGDVDQSTQDIAASNPFSTAAQQLRQFSQGQVANRQQEAASGITGQIATDVGNENYARGLDLSKLATQFSDSANNAIGQYAGVLNTNAGNLTDAIFKAEANQTKNPAYTAPAPAAPATPTPVTKPRVVTPKFTPGINPFAAQGARNAAF